VVVTLATTALVAVWRTIPVRTLVGVHVALGDLFLIWLAAKVNGH
jgi:hypothetical protein